MRRSQSSARWNDAPITHPLQATSTGASRSQSCWIPRWPRRMSSWCDSGTCIVPMELMSRPDENDLPSPRQMTTRTSDRLRSSPRMSKSRESISSSNALCLPGLSLVMVAIAPSYSRRTRSVTDPIPLSTSPYRGAGHLAPGRDVALVRRPADVGDRVDVGGLCSERTHRAPLRRAQRERVELVVPHRVAVRELVDELTIEVGEQHLEPLGRRRPRAVGMRVVRFPAHVVDVELVEQLHADPVVDEAAQDPLPEQLARAQALWLLVAHPRVVPVEGVLAPLEEVRDPADVALREGEAERREPLPEVRPQQVAEREDAHRRRQVHRHGRWGVRRRRRALRRRPDVAAQDRPRVGARREQRVPRVGVDARHAEAGWVLRERDSVATLVRQPPHLGRRRVDVEERQDPARDDPLRVGAAPLVDVPVVVRLDHDEVDAVVRPRVQDLAREPRPVREVEARELTARRHVAHPLVDVVATRAHVLVARRVDVEHLRWLARDRVEAEVAAAEVAVEPLLGAVGLVDDARHPVAVLRRDVGVEHVGGLADVVVDRDEDQLVHAHAHADGSSNNPRSANSCTTSSPWRPIMRSYPSLALSASPSATAVAMSVRPFRSISIAPGTRAKKFPGMRPDIARSTTLMRGDAAASTIAAWNAIVSRWISSVSSVRVSRRAISSTRSPRSGRARAIARRTANPYTSPNSS